MKTLLVVEDTKEYRELLQERLTKEGYTVLAAANGKEGLEIVLKDNVDLILLDLLMPQIDGVDFYYRMTHVLKKHIPIIVLTNLTTATGYGGDVKEVLIKAEVSLDEVTQKVKAYIGV